MFLSAVAIPRAKSANQCEIEDGTDAGAQRRPVAKGQSCKSMRGGKAARGEDEPSREETACDTQNTANEHNADKEDRFGGQDGASPRHCYERCPDHPGLVLVADGKRRQHRNENLAAPDAREAQLCGVMGAAHHAWCTGNDTVGHGADHHCDEHSPGEEPVVGLRRAQLGPLSVERPPHVSPLSPLAYGRALNCRTSFRMVFRSCVPHASLLRRRTQARIDATAAYRANTPRPAQGDSGKQPFDV